MKFRKRARDSEAKTRALMAFGELVLDLLERSAKLGDRLRRNPDTGILDWRLRDPIADLFHTHHNPPPARCEFVCVGKEVEQYLFDRTPVGIRSSRSRPMSDTTVIFLIAGLSRYDAYRLIDQVT